MDIPNRLQQLYEARLRLKRIQLYLRCSGKESGIFGPHMEINDALYDLEQELRKAENEHIRDFTDIYCRKYK